MGGTMKYTVCNYGYGVSRKHMLSQYKAHTQPHTYHTTCFKKKKKSSSPTAVASTHRSKVTGCLCWLCAAFVSLSFCFPDVIDGLLLQRAHTLLRGCLEKRYKTKSYLVKLKEVGVCVGGSSSFESFHWKKRKTSIDGAVLSWFPHILSCAYYALLLYTGLGRSYISPVGRRIRFLFKCQAFEVQGWWLVYNTSYRLTAYVSSSTL